MTTEFDPYYKWLGIPPKDQPPHHYRLLSIDLFESDPEVIDAASNRLAAFLQETASVEHADLAKRLLAEVTAARLVLLNPSQRAEYDRSLQAKLPKPEPVPPATPSPPPPSKARAVGLSPNASTPVIATRTPHHDRVQPRHAVRPNHSYKRRGSSQKRTQTQTVIILSCAGALCLAVLVIALVSSRSPSPKSLTRREAAPTRQSKQRFRPRATPGPADTAFDYESNIPRSLFPEMNETVLPEPDDMSSAVGTDSPMPAGTTDEAQEDPIPGPPVQAARLESAGQPPSEIGRTLPIEIPTVDNYERVRPLSIVARTGELRPGDVSKTGHLLCEFWQNVPGTQVENLLSRIERQPVPDSVWLTDGATTPERQGRYFGERLCGFLSPPQSGNYQFQFETAENDDARLYLSEDATPQKKRRIEREELRLEAGQSYYFELLHKELSGVDFVRVGWTLPSGQTEMPIPAGRFTPGKIRLPLAEHSFVELAPTTATDTTEGVKLEILDDSSLLATGAVTENGSYVVTVETQLSGITALRVEPLWHETLPGRGPGLGAGGQFELAEMTVQVSYVGLAELPSQVRLVDPTAVDELPEDMMTSFAIDGDMTTFWTGRMRAGHQAGATFLVSPPLVQAKTTWLTITLRHRINLGRFRLMATTRPIARPETPRDETGAGN